MRFVGASIVDPVPKPAGLDVGEPFTPYDQGVGLFPLPGDLLPKARQWCRALQRQIWATWWSAVETDTHLGPGAMHPDAEAVMVEAGLTVASVQVLYEIFLSAFPRAGAGASTSSWELFCHAEAEGRAASGLKLVRNGEMHARTIVVPNVERVVGVTFDDGGTGFRIFPTWAEYQELPVEVREARYPSKQAGVLGTLKTNQVHHDHYEKYVGGRPVIEPLLDTLAFFSRCDPRIVRMSADGNPRHFPLEPISERDYERRHPFWKTRTELEAELRDLCESRAPGGERRTCLSHIKATDGTVLAHCGYTLLKGGSRWMFTETPQQVMRDVVEFGYEYWAQWGEHANPLEVGADGELVANTAIVEQSALISDVETPWMDWFALSRTDAFAYRNQRRPAE